MLNQKEVDEVLTKVALLSATIFIPARRIYRGGYSGYFGDLDGHLFEVAHNPVWKLDYLDNLKHL